jgi:hypothetical protein
VTFTSGRLLLTRALAVVYIDNDVAARSQYGAITKVPAYVKVASTQGGHWHYDAFNSRPSLLKPRLIMRSRPSSKYSADRKVGGVFALAGD